MRQYCVQLIVLPQNGPKHKSNKVCTACAHPPHANGAHCKAKLVEVDVTFGSDQH